MVPCDVISRGEVSSWLVGGYKSDPPCQIEVRVIFFQDNSSDMDGWIQETFACNSKIALLGTSSTSNILLCTSDVDKHLVVV